VTFVPRKATMERPRAGAPESISTSSFSNRTTLGLVLKLGEAAFQPEVAQVFEVRLAGYPVFLGTSFAEYPMCG
jgi:hypothetical protein